MRRVRDDRVLRWTRIVARAVVPVLIAACIVLYGFPHRTGMLWSWEIAPPMSALFMGAGYGAGAWFFVRVAHARLWHEVSAGIAATSVFVTLLAVATVLHWPGFNHRHVSFWAWVALYAATPVLLPALWVINGRYRLPRAADPEPLLPWQVRVAAALVATAQLAVAAVLFTSPATVTSWWPWTLTPVSARSLASFATFPAVAVIAGALDGRWSALRISVEATAVGLGLVGLAVLRTTLDGPVTSVRLYVLSLVTSVVVTVAWLAVQSRQRRRASWRRSHARR